jgi:hypothetical protein
MSLLNSIGAKIGSGGAKGLMGTGMGKAAFGLGAVGLFGAGMINNSARSVVDAAGETAFNDPNADRAFMGEQGFSPGGIMDSMATSGGAQLGVAASAGLGALGGGLVAGALGKTIKSGSGLEEAVKVSSKVPLIGGKTLLKAGKAGKAPGLLAAGIIGGAALGATQFAGRYVERNKQFFQQSPYSRGSAMQASSTQAYGDIVLGMHNSRRG